ncbi:MAG TPA: mechanosensitive ion channel, partial [Acidiferrobacteraceae bacterium]|nr:mechanosensitive ion channel [Acidiferrobacteraceae bacterium]
PALRGQFQVVIRQVLSITTWIIGTLIVVQNLGYSITSLLAGLGIGGLAVAFAARRPSPTFLAR